MTRQVRLWHKAPFLRLLAALIAGILLQWHFQFPVKTITICFLFFILSTLGYFFLSLKNRYRFRLLQGGLIVLLFAATGAILVWLHDVRNDESWMGHHYQAGDLLQVRLKEPLVEKANSYKAEAAFQVLKHDSSYKNVSGKAIVYFKKNDSLKELEYGSQIVFKKPLQEIRNSGNPHAFDYQRYCLFEGITHQVYLTPEEFRVLPGKHQKTFWSFVFNARQWVIAHLGSYIDGGSEKALAQAILIGYKDDLDKNLVQSYSNTGVVHIIAISGLHLGIICAVLMFLTRPLKRKGLHVLRFLITVTSLWLFSILAGAQPSVLRAALMFSFMASGELFSKKTSVYNTLSASAFALLAVNPFFIWDVGFQLSYAAVISIVTFFRWIYGWLYFQNKAVDFFWKVAAVTLSAQIFTLPISIYHFHQMPFLFMFSNLVAVPVASLILIGEIILCGLFWFPALASWVGFLLSKMIGFLNNFIAGVDGLSFSVWNGLSISVEQTILLILFAGTMSFWIMERQKKMLWTALYAYALFMLLRSVSFMQVNGQQKLIVYNVPRHQAIDVIQGPKYNFIGDEALKDNDFLRNFHLQPSRIAHRVSNEQTLPPATKAFSIKGKQVVIVDSATAIHKHSFSHPVDLLILSGNPNIYLEKLAQNLQIRQLIIDGAVPPWKAKRWQQQADTLGIACHNVAEKGAFVLNLH